MRRRLISRATALLELASAGRGTIEAHRRPAAHCPALLLPAVTLLIPARRHCSSPRGRRPPTGVSCSTRRRKEVTGATTRRPGRRSAWWRPCLRCCPAWSPRWSSGHARATAPIRGLSTDSVSQLLALVKLLLQCRAAGMAALDAGLEGDRARHGGAARSRLARTVGRAGADAREAASLQRPPGDGGWPEKQCGGDGRGGAAP